MSLLGDIQTAAASDSASLSSILRKCQILAVRLKYEPFKEWVSRESNGYSAGVELPEYRVMNGVPSKADFMGVTHKLSNYPVPANIVPDKKLQTLIAKMALREKRRGVRVLSGRIKRPPWRRNTESLAPGDGPAVASYGRHAVH